MNLAQLLEELPEIIDPATDLDDLPAAELLRLHLLLRGRPREFNTGLIRYFRVLADEVDERLAYAMERKRQTIDGWPVTKGTDTQRTWEPEPTLRALARLACTDPETGEVRSVPEVDRLVVALHEVANLSRSFRVTKVREHLGNDLDDYCDTRYGRQTVTVLPRDAQAAGSGSSEAAK